MTLPLPELVPHTAPFWTGGFDGHLLIMACKQCDHRIHPPQPVCPACLSEEVEPRKASGRGKVYSWTINRQAWVPGLDVPYALAVIDLADQPGVRITAKIVGSDPEMVRIGAAVMVDFEPRDDVAIPVFRLTGE